MNFEEFCLNPQYTQFPHIISDYWHKKLGAYRFSVFYHIWRKTLGWNKLKDKISLRQLHNDLGYSKSCIIKCLKSLEELNLIKKFFNSSELNGYECNEYELNISRLARTYEDENIPICSISVKWAKNISTPPCSRRKHPHVVGEDIQKKDLTKYKKENITKEAKGMAPPPSEPSVQDKDISLEKDDIDFGPGPGKSNSMTPEQIEIALNLQEELNKLNPNRKQFSIIQAKKFISRILNRYANDVKKIKDVISWIFQSSNSSANFWKTTISGPQSLDKSIDLIIT